MYQRHTSLRRFLMVIWLTHGINSVISSFSPPNTQTQLYGVPLRGRQRVMDYGSKKTRL